MMKAMPQDAYFTEMFAQLSAIGRLQDGGTNRMALTGEDIEQRQWFKERLEDAGAVVHVDPIGNIFGVFKWMRDASCVLIGSHLDSQEHGGIFDGAYGVVAALAVGRRINGLVSEGKLHPKHNLAVVSWTNEEGARFEPSIMGSRVYTGELSMEEALRSRDLQDTSMHDALLESGWAGSESAPSAVAYAEIHVEQGTQLIESRSNIGMVTGNWAAVKMDVSIEGEQSHTGATAMADRRDALFATALLICETRNLVEEYPEDALRSSATKLRTFPHSPNIVSSHCTIHIEVRSECLSTALEAAEKLQSRFVNIERRSATTVTLLHREVRESMHYWNPGLAIAEESAVESGSAAMRMKTVSGHDSVALNAVMPTIMLFVPSEGGYAHSPKELTSGSDQQQGVRMLGAVTARLVTMSSFEEV
ncbi:MAG: hydantoinase/carbamoylase family amidase [Bifidobacterium sp.]|uniref:hydantoinase/carbamoylase family amidase n=1 Tax=Bifidobacterium sp. TaxID=41200 RepID=UPI0039EBC399